MENKRQESGGSSSSRNFDHLFGPKDSSSSSSSSTTSIFGSIFPPPSTMATGPYSGIMESLKKQGESSKAENNIFSSTEKNSVYQNETAEPCYLSSSIYYGGQENYSPKNKTTTESPHAIWERMTLMEAMLTALQEEIGGRARSIINTLPSMAESPSTYTEL